MLLAPQILAPADTARAVAQVYTVSLLATLPILLAIVAAIILRRAPAGTRVLVWRSAVMALLIVYFGRLLPTHWMTWVVPSILATPLVSLGTLQLAVAEYVAPVYQTLGNGNADGSTGRPSLVTLVLGVYSLGVGLVLVPLLRGWFETRRIAKNARPIDDPGWQRAASDTRTALRIRRSVRLVETREAVSPATWGVIRPVVLLPAAARVVRRTPASGLVPRADTSQDRRRRLHGRSAYRLRRALVPPGCVVDRAPLTRRRRARMRRQRARAWRSRE
jgi:hypothetical protein